MWLSCYSAYPASRRLWVHTQAPHKTRSGVSYLGMQRQENQKFVVLELEASLGYNETLSQKKKKCMSSISSLPKAVFRSLVFLHCPARTGSWRMSQGCPNVSKQGAE